VPETSAHCLKQNIKNPLKSTLDKKVMIILKTKHLKKIGKIISLKQKHMTYQIRAFEVANTKTIKLN